jgi:uncharacterized protein
MQHHGFRRVIRNAELRPPAVRSARVAFVALVACAALAAGGAGVAAQRPPVIDVHLHAYTGVPPGARADWAGTEVARTLSSPANAEAHLRATLAEMDRYNVVLAVVSGPEAAVRAWHAAAPDRFIGGAFHGDDGLPEHSVAALRALVEEGVVGVLGELGLQYFGIAPDDARLAPYYDYLEASGVPLALHTGLGPPGGPHSFAPAFRVELGRPTRFEPALAVRPRLRAYLMHAGWPFITETKAMMYIYPELHADVGVLAWALPTAAFHAALRELIDAGLGDRLLFGTDQMIWPGAVGQAIEAVEAVPFLSEAQKRAILYHNAARFLRLDDATIARHHGATP